MSPIQVASQPQYSRAIASLSCHHGQKTVKNAVWKFRVDENDHENLLKATTEVRVQNYPVIAKPNSFPSPGLTSNLSILSSFRPMEQARLKGIGNVGPLPCYNA